jgi:hypothetical protein
VALTRGYPVPPPVFNLLLKLTCPHLTRARSHTTLHTMAIERGRTLVLSATVRGSARHHPVGLVTFLAAGRTLRTVPISPRNGVAVLIIPRPAAKTFSVRYGGDGYNTPGAAQARRRRPARA